MHLSGIVFAFSSLISLSTAHFRLVDPPPRGFSEDMLTRFPCGGQSMSKSRTSVSLTDLEMPIALEMGHDQTAVQVLLALGSHPGSNFNITLVPTVMQTSHTERTAATWQLWIWTNIEYSWSFGDSYLGSFRRNCCRGCCVAIKRPAGPF
ncbi:hypothetical protein CISG_04736 [Coccidioides immitis RMSCC 3703]|uniref:Copper acquisition factor BIM1-like domain-containing protein n=1 Tax=Coccidioides immitis RMSCC 3703 TaxID=454286 RepID=A0A0J8TNL9_COCIT|nr:hypothetical protein CISG_04736 [Coccidioides immitis RMSCC 3703]